MNIQLKVYLYYLHLLVNSFEEDTRLKQAFVSMIETMASINPKTKSKKILANMRGLTRYDYEPYMFSIDALGSAKAAIIYYLILQLFNHRYHLEARVFTEDILDQLMLKPSLEFNFLNIPKVLLQNLKNFFHASDYFVRQELIQSLEQMKKQWNTYFFYELQFMFLVWENEVLRPNPLLNHVEMWTKFEGISLRQSAEKPEHLEPYTLYAYTLNSRQFYAFLSWDGRSCFNQLFEDLDESQIQLPGYWRSHLHQAPPFPHLETSQAHLFMNLVDYVQHVSSSITRVEKESLVTNIHVLKQDFLEINFYLMRAATQQNELYQDLQELGSKNKNLFMFNALLINFTRKHQVMIQVMAQIKEKLTLIKQRRAFPREFCLSLDKEVTHLQQGLNQRELAYQNFHQEMLEIFNHAHDLSFVISYRPRVVAEVLHLARWSLGLCLSAGLGFGLLASSSGMVFGVGLSLYLIFSSVVLLGLILGAKAFHLAFAQAGQDLSKRHYELLPSWNSPIPK